MKFRENRQEFRNLKFSAQLAEEFISGGRNPLFSVQQNLKTKSRENQPTFSAKSAEEFNTDYEIGCFAFTLT